jgi:hypothetical protein
VAVVERLIQRILGVKKGNPNT